MKKTGKKLKKTDKKLLLIKESVRELTPKQLSNAAGAAIGCDPKLGATMA